MKCGACNTDIPEGARFCPACGQPKGEPAEVPERQVTVSRQTVERISGVLGQIHQEQRQIQEQMEELKTQHPLGEHVEKLERALDDLRQEQERGRQALENRRIEYAVNESPAQVRTLDDAIFRPTRNEQLLELQRVHDNTLLMAVILRRAPSGLRYYEEEFKPRADALTRAMATSATGEGKEWVFTQVSADLIDRIDMEQTIAILFREVRIPQGKKSLTLPVSSTGPKIYLVDEATDATGDKTFREALRKTLNIEFTVKTLGSFIVVSKEQEEDAIVNALDDIREQIVIGADEGYEDGVINGDQGTAAAHIDSDVTVDYDHRCGWDGLRVHVNADAKVDLSTFNVEGLANVLGCLDSKYARKLKELTWASSVKGAIKLLILKDANGNPVVLTQKDLPEDATIVNGYLGRLLGINAVISGFHREDLNASGV